MPIEILIFYLVVIFIFILKRKNVFFQYFAFFLRTSFGKETIDKLSKRYKNVLEKILPLVIISSLFGMILVSLFLIKGVFELLLFKDSLYKFSPVIPGIEIPKTGIYIPFFYGIISIFIVALVHEGSHGIYARLFKIPVKSTGIFLFGPFLGAFVEPEEKLLNKLSLKEKLAIFSAGPFSNIVLGLLVLLFLATIFPPIYSKTIQSNYVEIVEVIEGTPAEKANLTVGTIIYKINGVNVKTIDDFFEVFSNLCYGDNVTLETSKGVYNITLTNSSDCYCKGYLGIVIKQKDIPKKGIAEVFNKILKELYLLLKWLAVISLGVGLANLLPIGPLDGGRILNEILIKLLDDKEKALNYMSKISSVFALLLIINILLSLIF